MTSLDVKERARSYLSTYVGARGAGSRALWWCSWVGCVPRRPCAVEALALNSLSFSRSYAAELPFSGGPSLQEMLLGLLGGVFQSFHPPPHPYMLRHGAAGLGRLGQRAQAFPANSRQQRKSQRSDGFAIR